MSNGPIKVLQILPHLNSGGVEQGVLDLSLYMKKMGIEPFVCSNGGNRVQELLIHEIAHITLPVHSKNPFLIRRNVQKLVNLIQELNIDLVHARSRAPAWGAYYACKKANIPFVTTFHGTYNFHSSLKKFYNSIMARGDRVIAISEFIKKHILQNYKAYLKENTPLTVIYRGINTDYFNPSLYSLEDIRKYKEKLGIDSAKKVILLPGRLTRWKGHQVLIEAISLLQNQNIVCLLVGSSQGRDKYKAELQKRIISLGLEEKIKILDDSHPMPLMYALSDAVVHASTDPEAFGRVVAEAQAMGKPVITNDLGAPKEIILRNETGWLVPPNQPPKLADKLGFVLDFQQPYLDEIALKARERILHSFSLEQMCSKTLLIYKELLNR